MPDIRSAASKTARPLWDREARAGDRDRPAVPSKAQGCRHLLRQSFDAPHRKWLLAILPTIGLPCRTPVGMSYGHFLAPGSAECTGEVVEWRRILSICNSKSNLLSRFI